MRLNASKFIQGRRNIVRITYDRVNHIMSYMIDCYLLIQKDKPLYSKSYVASTAYTLEDYLKMEFVDRYLVKNKHLLATRLSSLDEVTFTYETVKPFLDASTHKERSDKIDIFINRLGLKDEWAVPEEHLYLAVECKLISVLSDCKAYIGDIQNFCDREHRQLRIPFESQLAFIENPRIDHIAVSTEVNKRLNATSTITTTQFLKPHSIKPAFQGNYSSKHRKNFKKKASFVISHLLFDYSKLITA